MQWLKAAARPRILARNPVETTSNYFLGSDRTHWKAGIRNYAAVEYQNLYPGVNLIFHGNPHELEYDIALQPGADVSIVSFDFEGFSRIEVNQDGDLVLHAPEGDLIQRHPVVYEENGAARRTIQARYVLLGNNPDRFHSLSA